MKYSRTARIAAQMIRHEAVPDRVRNSEQPRQERMVAFDMEREIVVGRVLVSSGLALTAL